VNESSSLNPTLVEGPPKHAGVSWWGCIKTALIVYCLTGLVVLLGVFLGLDFFQPLRRPRSPEILPHSGNALLLATTRWDGQYYLEIASQGYAYDPGTLSNVAFFPLYPILVAGAYRTTGMAPAWAGLLVAHMLLIATFVLLAAYLRQRYSRASAQLVAYTVLAFGLFPTTFFFRMTYSESTFLVLAVLCMFGMEREWRPVVIAGIVGLATASRSVGVALVPVFWVYVWARDETRPHPLPLSRERERGEESTHPRALSRERERGVLRRLAPVVCLTPVALWGLLAYMAFQYAEFGEPLAFAKTQSHWRVRPAVAWGDKALSLASWEPIWSAYMSSWPGYVGQFRGTPPTWCNLQMANPLFFVAAAALVGFGARKRWLSAAEILLGGGLLLIPYVTRGFDTCMASQGRFAAVVFPVYLVLGRLLCGAPLVVSVGVFGLSAVYLAIYSALFAAGYLMI
jgi:hypothetical protein